jgi:hypothetical protein
LYVGRGELIHIQLIHQTRGQFVIEGKLDPSDWPSYLAASLAGIFGVWLGAKAHKRADQQTIVRGAFVTAPVSAVPLCVLTEARSPLVILILLILASVSMLDVPRLVSIVLTGLTCGSVLIAWSVSRLLAWRRSRSLQISAEGDMEMSAVPEDQQGLRAAMEEDDEDPEISAR